MILGMRVARTEKRRSALTKQLVDKLKEAVIRGDLSPGAPLDEATLASSLKAAQPALREALRALEAEGFVTFRPDNEVIISKPSRAEIEDHFVIAAALEGLAARLAVERARPAEIERLRELHQAIREASQQRDANRYFDARNAFHRLIADMARNERLYRMLEELRRVLQKTRPLSLRLPQRLESSMRDHDQILDAFIKKNPDLAAAAMSRHWSNRLALLSHAAAEAGKT